MEKDKNQIDGKYIKTPKSLKNLGEEFSKKIGKTAVPLVDTGYLYGEDKNRIFINTSLGCEGKCSYCYLGKIGYSNKEITEKKKTAEEIIQETKKIGIGKDTLISLGCFSECRDEMNKPETIKLIKYFLQQGNQIQLSTKKEILSEEIEEIKNLIQYEGQLVIFISSATISKWETIEKGTDSPEKRFNSFKLLKESKLPIVLYMKPILKGKTIQDVQEYIKIIKKYNIQDIVVGTIFTTKIKKEKIPFLRNNKLFYNEETDEEKIRNTLKSIKDINIFTRSSHVMKKYKQKHKEKK